MNTYIPFCNNKTVTAVSCDAFTGSLYKGSVKVTENTLRSDDVVSWTAKNKSGGGWHITLSAKDTDLRESEELKRVVGDWLDREREGLPTEATQDGKPQKSSGDPYRLEAVKDDILKLREARKKARETEGNTSKLDDDLTPGFDLAQDLDIPATKSCGL